MRNLRIEQLESRELLAIAAFYVDLFDDDGGVPGDLITDDRVEVGDTFFAEIMARELHPARSGFQGVSLDVAWDPDVLQEIDAPFDPNALITADLPLDTKGLLDNAAGTIRDLGGSAFPAFNIGRAIGNLAPERFALLHFRAEKPAESSLFSMRQGRSGIATMPVSSLGSAQLYFEPQAITVTANSRDVNNDGVVNPVDVIACMDAVVSGGDFTADVNQDGVVSSLDVLVLVLELNRRFDSPATEAVLLADAWHNSACPMDVDDDGLIRSSDLEVVIQHRYAHGNDLPSGSGPPFVDVDDDGFATGADAALIWNYLDEHQLWLMPIGR